MMYVTGVLCRNGEEVVIKIFPKHESSLQLKNTEKVLHGEHL